MRNLFLLTFLISCLYVKAQTSGGPDAYGYTWKSSKDAASGVTYNWIDIKSRPSVYDITSKFDDDNVFGPINFSFNFPFYWYFRSEMYISANGAILFQGRTLGAPFDIIPTVEGQADDYIAPFLTDLTLNKQGGNVNNPGKVYFYTDFKDTVIVSWEEVPFLVGTTYGGSNTFQVILSRADKAITFQYKEQTGQVGNGCTDGPADPTNKKCFLAGIENVSGQVGLPVAQGSASLANFSTIGGAFAIKYFPPANSTYVNRDVTVQWNNEPGSGGVFIPKGSSEKNMRSKLLNQGLTESPSLQVTAKVFANNTTATPLSNTSLFSGIIPVAEDTVLTFQNTIPTANAGLFRFEANASWQGATGDQVTANNKLSQMFKVIDTALASMTLDYTGSISTTGFTWASAANFTAGMANYIEPPIYPVKIKTVNAHLSTFPIGGGAPTDPVRMRIYDDDGINLFGVKDGSPGTILFDSLVIADASGTLGYMEGYNKIAVNKTIQINSGGVYVAVLQGGTAVAYSTETDNTPSYRGYEVFNGVFSPYRNRGTQDVIIGMDVEKGDMAQVLDLKLEELVSPLSSDVITDSVQVMFRLKNVGNQSITGPFDVAYKADTRAEVIESIPASVTIPVSGTYDYSFIKKSARPSPPKTQYDRFCARVSLSNDFDLLNDTICYSGTNMGINGFDRRAVNIYPNPVNEKMLMRYSLVKSSDVHIEIFDLVGKQVYSFNENKTAGTHNHEIDVKDLGNGVYICRIHTSEGFYTEKLLINR